MNKKKESKIIAILLYILMLTAILAGCTQGESQNRMNQEENYDYTGYTDYTDYGLNLTIKLPREFLDNEIIIPGKYEIMFGDIFLIGKDVPKAETDPSQHMDLFFMPQKGEYCLFRILAYPQDKWDGWMDSGKKAADITGNAVSEEIFRKDSTVYILDQPTIDIATFDSDMKTIYDEFIRMLPAIKAGIKPMSNSMDDMSAFTTKDLNGESVDNSIFEEYQLTMINIWATFCRPCIKEMPGLKKMSEDMPEGTQLISIVGDVDDEDSLELARQIANDTGVSFTTIIPDESLKQYLDDNIVAYPTTLFVDSSGKIVGEAIVGERDMSVYNNVLNDRLAQLSSPSQ